MGAMNGGVFRSPANTSRLGKRIQAVTARAKGLVNAPISGRSVLHEHGREEVYCRGTVLPGGIRIKVLGTIGTVRNGGGDRGVICGMSPASHRRMRDSIMEIDLSQGGVYFGSCTYGGSGWQVSPPDASATGQATSVVGIPCQPDWRRVKRHSFALWKRLKRRYRDTLLGVVWKWEIQEERFKKYGDRVPHLHFVVFFKGEVELRELRAFLSKAWYEVVGSGDIKHFKAGTEIHEVWGTSGNEAARFRHYLVKYLSKDWQSVKGEETGRIWGEFGEIPKAVFGVFALTAEDWIRFTRRLRRWGREKSKYFARVSPAWQGLRLLGNPETYAQLLRGLASELKGDAEKGILAGLSAVRLQTGQQLCRNGPMCSLA